jgi:hypothetical protein
MREDVERWKEDWRSGTGSTPHIEELFGLAFCAFDMCDELKSLYDPGLDSFAVPTKELERIVKQFDGDDND